MLSKIFYSRLASKTTDVNWTKKKDPAEPMNYYTNKQFKWFNPRFESISCCYSNLSPLLLCIAETNSLFTDLHVSIRVNNKIDNFFAITLQALKAFYIFSNLLTLHFRGVDYSTLSNDRPDYTK